ncbi:MAG: hypothetical protein QHH14_02330 [Clostridiales bacterium]|nr:hypothetical protein [Clostridiales bacterium]
MTKGTFAHNLVLGEMKNFSVYGLMILSVLGICSFGGNVFARTEEIPSKNYVLMFHALEYDARLGDAAEYFLKEVLKPTDSLILFTPQRSYNFSQKTRETTPLEKLIQVTKDVLRRDISMEASTYKDIIQQMETVVRMLTDADPTPVKSLITQYSQLKENLFAIRKLDGNLFFDLAEMFKQAQGEKHIIILYEKRLRVIPNRQTMERLRANPDVRLEINEVLEAESSREVMNADTVTQALKDGGVKLHFVYLHTKVRYGRDMEPKEFSGDIYNVFSKIAKETGGVVMIASVAETALKEIVGSPK